MNFRSILTLGAGVAVLLMDSHPAAAESIFGRWITDDRAAIVRVEKCGEMLCGVIEKILDPRAPRNDINNPDPRQRSSPLIGTLVLRGFVRSGSAWDHGQAYDPKAGKSYRSMLELLDGGILKVKGCVLFICQSRYWNRAR